MKKILLLCSNSYSVTNFRLELIKYLSDQGNEIFLVVGEEISPNLFEDLNVKVIFIPFDNRSKNPFATLRTISKIKKCIKEIKPDVLFTFQIKPNVIGSLAVKSLGFKNVFCMVEGLGDHFQPSNFKERMVMKIVCFLYKKSFKKVKNVFFLNEDDKNELVSRKLIKEEKGIVIHGIGIDTNKYLYSPTISPDKRVIMMSRLLRNKGIIDYCNLARKVKKTRPDIIFDLYGGESQLTAKDLKEYIEDGSINYCGYSNKINEVIVSSRIVVSTSFYREGFPRTILEAMALGKSVVASNVVGNRDAVLDGKTGYLLPAHDTNAFANRIIDLIDDNNLLLELGANSRKICEECYDSNIINSFIYKTIINN